MKRVLALLPIALLGWSPGLAANGSGTPPAGLHKHRPTGDASFHHRHRVPGFVWIGEGPDPLSSWDDGYFSDLKYGHDHRHEPHAWHQHGSSGDVEVVNGQARYHYDRGYPYRHYDYGGDGHRHRHIGDD